MKKAFVSVCFVFGFITNTFYQRNLGTSILNKTTNSSTSGDSSLIVNNIPANNQPIVDETEGQGDDADDSIIIQPAKNTPIVTKPTPTPVAIPTPLVNQGKYKNGTYTGTPADANYGTIQVQAIITNGKISDVNFLSYPNSRPNSVKVSNYAMPILKKEAISAQSENVDAVSGASYTSAAFIESLGGALSQAM